MNKERSGHGGDAVSRNGALYQWLADACLFADTVLSITSRLMMRRRTVMMHVLTTILIWRRDMAGSQGVINGTLVLGKFTTLTEGPTSYQSQLQWIFISIRQTGVVISRWGRCSKQWRWRCYCFSKRRNLMPECARAVTVGLKMIGPSEKFINITFFGVSHLKCETPKMYFCFWDILMNYYF